MSIFLMLILLMWTHYVADFLLQSDEMALNKSKDNGYLLFHSVIYSVCFIWVSLTFVSIMFVSHFVIDFITSRGTSYLFKKNERHWFFCLIGLDQILHINVIIILLFLEGYL